MHIHNLYEDAQGESHWRDIEVEWTQETPGGPASERQPATGAIFRLMPVTYDLDWHPAPRRQYVVQLDGDVQITASDGEVRVIKAGEIVLVEDVAGKGHRSKNVSGRPYHVLFVALD
jgi:oxalate decarboxylase/phosphoglucose isomerase-like protein (cupin superfamily)